MAPVTKKSVEKVKKALNNDPNQNALTPQEIVAELDKHIIGQDRAKRAIAIALRNRWRRRQVSEMMRDEITPKNILMIGPTGSGKTEIARRAAKLHEDDRAADGEGGSAPFIKVDATKFTEVGYVGSDVEKIIRDLVEVAVKKTRERAMRKVRESAKSVALERILNVLVPTGRKLSTTERGEEKESAARQRFRRELLEGSLNEKEIEIDIVSHAVGLEIMAPPGMEEMTSQLQSMFQSLMQERTKPRKLKVKDAIKILSDEEALKMIDDDGIKAQALRSVEQNGIVFIDEIDKVARRSETGGGEVSREGVQRDLLPLIEGTTVSTKYGIVKTDHILFIASGAFHIVKPSDLLPELQGRLPIRVELQALKKEDFVRILVEPDACLTKQYTELLATEGVKLEFTAAGIEKIAEIACHVNETTENIGARRLHTVLERLLEEVDRKSVV